MIPFTLNFFTVLLAATNVMASTTNHNKTIHVRGTGSVTLPKDTTSIHLSIMSTAQTAQESSRMTAIKSSSVIDTLRTFNISKLQTENISLRPVYNYSGTTPIITGFESINSISFASTPTESGVVIDSAIQAGANRIDSITITANDEARDLAYNVALGYAISNATSKADAVLGSLNGMCLGDPITISIETIFNSPPMPIFAEASRSSDAMVLPSTEVIAGEQVVKANVDLVFEYLSCTDS